MTMREDDTPQQKQEREIRAMFYGVNARPPNLDNLMASDGEPWGVDQPYLRPERSLDFNTR